MFRILQRVNISKYFLLFLALIFSTANLFASGFQINEHGARAMGLSGAFTGLANDASAVYFNPAGITQLSGTRISGGTTLIAPRSSFRGPSPSITQYDLSERLFTPINFYATHQFSDEFYAGIGVNNPYGLGTEWELDWVGRFMAVKTEIVTFFINPVVSYKISDELSIGAGAVFAIGDVTIKRWQNLSPFAGEAYVALEGDGNGFGFTGGLLYKPMKELSIGLSYRSEVNFEFEGDAKIEEGPALFEGRLPTGTITAPLTTPQNITFGLAVLPSDELTLTADFQYVGWSSYDKLEVTFEDMTDDEKGGPLVSSSVRDFDNSFIVRAGGEYKLFENFDVRAGFIYDSNPVKDERLDPTLPDADRLGLNVGFGYKLTEGLTLDLAYLFLRFTEREITDSEESYSGIEGSKAPMNGFYSSVAHLFGINFSYNF